MSVDAELGLAWLRIVSWHLGDKRWRLGLHTLCGRTAPEQAPQPFPPAGAATCETCFRVRELRASR